jgi:hypothetical protein
VNLYSLFVYIEHNGDESPKDYVELYLKARLHASPRLINTVESTTLNSTVERYCLHSSTEVNEAVDFKMAANELVREGVKK